MSPAGDPVSCDIAIVHDYLTQRGGAERVVLDLAAAFPGAPLYTSLYERGATFPAFGQLQVVTLPLDRVRALRGHHRLAFPLLAPAFSRLHLDEAVVVCSSTGWAHGTRVSGCKVVYCHTPARWLYQTSRYLGARRAWARLPVEAFAAPLRTWDRRAARSADRYLVNSTVVRDRVRSIYGIDAEVLAPAPGLDPTGPVEPVDGLDTGFLLCVSRLLAYKNLDALVEAFMLLPRERLVVAGAGPLLEPLRRAAPPNVRFLGAVTEAQLRWLYRCCAGVVAASYEDFGLTPVEGLGFGKPTAALRWGGFLDTVLEGETGVFFDRPVPAEIAESVTTLRGTSFPPRVLDAQAEGFSRARFLRRIREIVAEERARAR